MLLKHLGHLRGNTQGRSGKALRARSPAPQGRRLNLPAIKSFIQHNSLNNMGRLGPKILSSFISCEGLRWRAAKHSLNNMQEVGPKDLSSLTLVKNPSSIRSGTSLLHYWYWCEVAPACSGSATPSFPMRRGPDPSGCSISLSENVIKSYIHVIYPQSLSNVDFLRRNVYTCRISLVDVLDP
jgi:hypothetical protein